MIRDRHRVATQLSSGRWSHHRVASVGAIALAAASWLACGPNPIVIGIPYQQNADHEGDATQESWDARIEATVADESGTIGGQRIGDAAAVPDGRSVQEQREGGFPETDDGSFADRLQESGPSDSHQDGSPGEGDAAVPDGAVGPMQDGMDAVSDDGSAENWPEGDGGLSLAPICATSCPTLCADENVCGSSCDNEGTSCISQFGDFEVCTVDGWLCGPAPADAWDCSVLCILPQADN